MEMCPYCGEEVPDDSARCWKCGTELSEGAAKPVEGDDELEVPDDEDDGDGKKAELVECPHCGSPVAKKARRCRECGRMVEAPKASAAASLWRWGTWVLVLGVGLLVTIGVILVSLDRKRSQDRSKAITVPFAELANRVQPLAPANKINKERRAEVWTKDFENRFVKWEGVVVEKPTDLEVKVSHTKGQKKPDVLVKFLDGARAELDLLKPDDKIVYSARLSQFGAEGVAFVLVDGLVEK